MDIRTPYIRTPHIGTPSIKAQSVGASLVTGATKDVIATPVITLTGNSVTITCSTTGATIYYTLDGSTPTSSSTQYSAAFTLDSSCTIKAIAIKGGKSSGVAEESYVKPVTYLTQWKIVGNSEVHGQEIWSCGEYNATDGKWHILVQPLGGSIADIALDEPLRKVNDVADKIEFADNVATVTRYLAEEVDISSLNWAKSATTPRFTATSLKDVIACPADNIPATLLCPIYVTRGNYYTYHGLEVGISVAMSGTIGVYDDNDDMSDANALADFLHNIDGLCLVYALATATTETITAPQIEEADSYACVISQGAKAISWSSFITE